MVAALTCGGEIGQRSQRRVTYTVNERMNVNDEEYEAMRANAEREAGLAAELDPALRAPLPPDWDGDRDVDPDKIKRVLLAGAPADAAEEIRSGRLRWSLAGFDENGRGWVSVIRADTGEAIGGARVHWTGVAR